MFVKRYIANDMSEVMEKIRRDLGPEAVILSQRSVRQKGAGSLFRKKLVEVMVAYEPVTDKGLELDTAGSRPADAYARPFKAQGEHGGRDNKGGRELIEPPVVKPIADTNAARQLRDAASPQYDPNERPVQTSGQFHYNWAAAQYSQVAQQYNQPVVPPTQNTQYKSATEDSQYARYQQAMQTRFARIDETNDDDGEDFAVTGAGIFPIAEPGVQMTMDSRLESKENIAATALQGAESAYSVQLNNPTPDVAAQNNMPQQAQPYAQQQPVVQQTAPRVVAQPTIRPPHDQQYYAAQQAAQQQAVPQQAIPQQDAQQQYTQPQAALQQDATRQPETQQTEPQAIPQQGVYSPYTQSADGEFGYDFSSDGADPRNDARIEELNAKLAELKGVVRQLSSKILTVEKESVLQFPKELMDIYNALVEQDVQEELARALCERAQPIMKKTGGSAINIVRTFMKELIGAPAPLQAKEKGQSIIMLVGPTGAGKTTTLVKLAGMYSFGLGLNVGCINTDTYRVAAQEQLRAYTEIMDIPCCTVYTPDEMSMALSSLSDCDLVFIDTAGKTMADVVYKDELRAYFMESGADEVLLHIPASMSRTACTELINNFSFFEKYRLVITKLDEVSAWGNILNILAVAKKSLAFITVGQSVPQDIEVPDISEITKKLLESVVS